RQMEGEQAARTAGLRFVGIGVCKARIEIKVHRRDEPRVTQGRRRPEAAQIMFARKLLEARRQLSEVLNAAKEPAVMAQPVGAEFEAARAHGGHPLPVDFVLCERQIPRGPETPALLEFGHRVHPLEALAALDVMGQDDAALVALRPPSDMPAALDTEGVKGTFEPVAP